jgi:hypothetical protein
MPTGVIRGLILLLAISALGLSPSAAAASGPTGPISGLVGKCIDDSQSSTTNGNPVILYHCTAGANQAWNLPGNGTIEVLGKCLDITGANSTANGTLVELWSCNGGANQQWTYSKGNLINPQSGKCLDVPSSNTVDSTQLDIYTCGSAAPNQTWTTPSSSGNLILGGDGQFADCSLSGYEETTNPGWTITAGDPNVVCYANTGGFPSSSVTGAQPGEGFFTGGQRGNASMFQDVSVSADASAIDAGTATYDLSGWLGGYGSQNDRADVVATFLSSSGGSLGTSEIGPVTNSQRKNTTEFLSQTASGKIPVGTRSIQVTFNAIWTTGGTTDGYGQNLSLTVTPALPAPTLTPPVSTVPHFDHVFLVYMENENYSASSNNVDGGAGIIGNSQAPYENSLAQQNSSLTDYFAVTHNSDPNYDAVAGGQTFGHSAGSGSPTSNCFSTCTWDVPSLGDEATAAGLTWKQYAQSASGDCDTTQSGYYYPDDVPFGQFESMRNNLSYCDAHWQPLPQMLTDLESTATTPNFVWFDADDCDDMESCGISAGDTWLEDTLPALFDSPAWTQQRSLLIITFDEDGNNESGGFGSGQSNQVPAFVIGSPGTVKTGYQSTIRYDHYSTARTIEQALGLPPMTENDSWATPYNDVFTGN